MEHDSGPALVIAGPGAGKTTILADKLIDLCQENDSRNIYAITFTNLAAGEMHDKVIRRCANSGREVPEPNISTLHSLAKGLLHRFHERIGLPSNFRVIGSDQEQLLLDDVRIELKNSHLNLGLSQKRYLNRAKAKRAFASKQLYDTLQPIPDKHNFATQEQFNDSYSSLLRYYNSLDWYDVVAVAVEMLTKHEGIQKEICSDIQFLLVDEYQDLNRADQELIHLLSNNTSVLLAFGDDDQSIYETMRFANPSGISRFRDLYPDAQIYPISVCWRCASSILDAAWRLVDVPESVMPNRLKKSKPIANPRRGHGKLEVGSFRSPKEEIEKISGVLGRLTSDQSEQLKIRILFHSKELGHDYVDQLAKLGHVIENLIGRQTAGNEALVLLFETLNLVKDRSNNFASRVILGKLFEFKPKDIAKFRSQSLAHGATLWDEVIAYDDIPAGLQEYALKIDVWAALEDPNEVLGNVIEFLGIGSDSEIKDLLEYWDSLENPTLEKLRLSLERGIEVTSEAEVAGSEATTTSIVAMTMHGAKGLEGDVIIIPALEDEFIPDESYMPEMRRLVYMSITRAEQLLLISHSWSRKGKSTHRTGEHRAINRPRSRFIDEFEAK